MPSARLFRGQLLPLAQQVRRDERVRYQTAEGTEENARRVDARNRGNPRGLAKKVVNALSRRELVRQMTARGLSERRVLQVIRMSASALTTNRGRIVTRACVSALWPWLIAALWRRDDLLKLREAGEVVNHKRVEHLYTEALMQVKRRKRKRNSITDRQPLDRVWSMDFVFDRTAEVRAIKSLTVVDAPHNAVAIVPERAIGGRSLMHIWNRLAMSRGLFTDNGQEFCGRAMQTWLIKLILIELGKPNQNAYIESFNSRFRDECLNEHWFTSLSHAKVVMRPGEGNITKRDRRKGLVG